MSALSLLNASLLQKVWPFSKKSIAHETALCWFCGKSTKNFGWGLSIGEMVYSSNILNSRALAEGELENPQKHHQLELRNKCKMCHQCIRQYALTIGDLDDSYIQQHLVNQQSQDMEIADTDTFLLPWYEKKFPFGCWLNCFTEIDIREKVWSLSLAELYLRGFRLAGEIWIARWEADQFLTKHASEDESVPLPDGFLEHVASAIHVDDPLFGQRLGRLKAVVYDVSIVLAAKELASSV